MPRGKKREDLTQRKFHRLTVQRYVSGKKWECLCQCGTITEVAAANLKNGHTKSCGCLASEVTAARALHGHLRVATGRSLTYRTWDIMIQRCTNPKCSTFYKYGARGITVCERWGTFVNFLADMGERPSSAHTIDRFPNQAGNYEPGNCRWATTKQQARNVKSNWLITHKGRTQCLAEWAEEAGMRPVTLAWRLRAGWDMERALTRPVQ